MKRILLAGVAAALVFLAPLTATAQTGTMNGTVVSTTSTAVVVRADDGVVKTFIVDNSSMMPTVAIKAGDRIRVNYSTRTAGDMLVTDGVTIPAAGPAPPSR